MKKAIYLLTAFSFIAVSCSKEGFEPTKNDPTVDPGRLTVVTGADLDGGLVPMNETFTVSGKAEALSYTYKVYAESPFVNTLQTAATGTAAGGKFVFVTWHTEGFATGGAVSVYEYNGTDYSYVARVDFDDTDWHDLVVEEVSAGVEYNLYLAGQRNPDSSGYLLATHNGAIAGKLTFNNNATDKFDLPNYSEIPLESFGANGILMDGTDILVVTGNGTGASTPAGGIYEIDAASFDFVSDSYGLTDGEFITESAGNIVALNRTGATAIEVQASAAGAFSFSAGATDATLASSDNERNAITGYSATASSKVGILAALGTDGVYYVDENFGSGDNYDPVADFDLANNIGSAALGISHDATNELIYVAAGGGGLHVLADGDYADGKALISEFDLIGKFIPPSGAPFNTEFVCKDVTVYNSDQISIASGEGGMFFVKQNN